MTKENQSVSLYRGEDKDLEITIKDGDGVVINVTSWKLQFSVRLHGDASALITLKNAADGGGASQIEMTTPASGLVTVKLLDTLTDDLTVDASNGYTDYIWDLKRTDADNEAILTIGRFRLKVPMTQV